MFLFFVFFLGFASNLISSGNAGGGPGARRASAGLGTGGRGQRSRFSRMGVLPDGRHASTLAIPHPVPELFRSC